MKTNRFVWEADILIGQLSSIYSYDALAQTSSGADKCSLSCDMLASIGTNRPLEVSKTIAYLSSLNTNKPTIRSHPTSTVTRVGSKEHKFRFLLRASHDSDLGLYFYFFFILRLLEARRIPYTKRTHRTGYCVQLRGLNEMTRIGGPFSFNEVDPAIVINFSASSKTSEIVLKLLLL